ncbi:MAG: hypothetical protein J0I41_00965 [Filimonas sp.]|nr:hypothetical protein [Filimonas sp.]
MKKIIACLAIAFSLISIHSFAQDADRMARMKEMMKQQYKDSLQFSDDKASKVADIQAEFMPQRMEIMRDQSATPADKQTKMKDLQDKIKAKLKGVLTDDEITKLEAFQERNRGRMGGGGGRRGGNR